MSKPFLQRLEEIKAELQPRLQSRLIFMMNPKDTRFLESVIAWTVIPKRNLEDMVVEDDATLKDLWEMAEPNMFAFATALGVTIKDAIPRLGQLKTLEIIYPDGTIYDKVIALANIYVKGQLNALQKKAENE